MKKCKKCHIEKPNSDFPKDASRPDGFSYWCKQCRGANNKKYQAEHADVRSVYHVKYNTEHAGEHNAYAAKYYAEHSKHVKRNARVVTWRAEHPEVVKAANAKWRAEHPGAVKAISENRRSRIVGNGGSFTEDEWNALLLFYDFRCLRCGRDDVLLTADHVKPISAGGSNDISNIQPLCRSCNSAKGIETIDYRSDADEYVGGGV